MRIAFLILVIGHGLIHLLGFVKGYGLSEVKDLTQPISKPVGVVWLVAFILFAIVALLFALKNAQWWVLGVIAVVVSQVLIMYFWQDAKFGTIANVIILLVTIIGYGTWHFDRSFENEVTNGLKQTASIPDSILTEADIQQLPEPVKKYIRYAGALGKPKVTHFKAEFTGKIRKNAASEWMPLTSVQYNFMGASERLFFLDATMKSLPVAGFHCFKNGTAYMDIRLFSLFKVQYQTGKEMGVSETVTFFNDMCCLAPATLIDKRIKWLETDGDKAKASFTNNGITISAWLYFNDKGELINFITDDRYAAGDNNTFTKRRWSTPLRDYKETGGYNLFGNAETIYRYPEGEFCYATFSLTRVEYNCKDFK
jgi:hypothetical protein